MFAELCFLYSFLFLKYLFVSNEYDLSFYNIIISMFTLMIHRFMGNKFSEEINDYINFLLHILFISICFSLLTDILSSIYQTIFYFGFTNTMVTVILLLMVAMSEMASNSVGNIHNFLYNFNIGKKIIGTYNYLQKIFYEIYDRMVKWVHYLIEYIWTYTKIIFVKFMEINKKLSDNSRSKKIKINFANKYYNTRDYVLNNMIKSYLINSFQNSMKNQYKNTISMETINMNAEGNDYEQPEDLDDDSENTNISSADKIDFKNSVDDLVQREEPKPPQTLKVEETENKISETVNDKNQALPQVTKEDKKATFRKKLQEMKSIRTGMTARNQKMAKNNLSNAMNNPEFKQMMDAMMKGNNLENLMKQIPKRQNVSINDEYLKKVLEDLGKKEQ